MARLARHVFPRLGTRPITDITPPEMLSVVRMVEKAGALDMAQLKCLSLPRPFFPLIDLSLSVTDVGAVAYVTVNGLPFFGKNTVKLFWGLFRGSLIVYLYQRSITSF